MKKAVMTVVLCAVVVGLGYGATVVGAHLRGTPAKVEASVPATPAKGTSVKVQVLQPTTVEDRLVLTGGVEPWQDIMMSAETRGVIEWQGVEEGARIAAGQELVKIDTGLLRARLDQAKAAKRLADQELERIERLSKKRITTAQNLDTVRAQCDMAAADLRLVELQLEKSVVAAPVEAVVDTLFKEESEFVDVGTPLVRLVQVHKVKVQVGIPERDVPFFAEGNPVSVALDALQGRTFSGIIGRIGTTAEAATLTFVAEIEVDNADGAIKPGMIARATLVRKTFPNSVVAPIFSVLSVDNQRFVFVEQEGAAHVRPIEIGVILTDGVQVTRGLSPGDRLVVVGQRDLKEGEPVQVAEVL